jgi:L-alanine-DL-glutamate epimerase-like enolase superfamily enzyme
MKLDWRSYRLTLREPLRISRSTMAARDAVAITLTHDGASGHGEVVTSVYYDLNLITIERLLTGLQPAMPRYPDPEALLDGLPELAGTLPAGVLAAIDAAAHDLIGHRDHKPVYQHLDRPAVTAVQTACTIGLVPPAHAADTARQLTHRGFQLIKVKAGDDADIARVAAVRQAAPDARLLLDPNGAWTPGHAAQTLEQLSPYRLDAVEQPIAPGTAEQMAWLSTRTEVPIIADEDAATVAHVHALAGAVAGVNVKLAKCGGITAAVQIIDAAHEHGMDVMLGCLVASSLGIAPAVHLAGQARWTDLDGHLLLADDPWAGIGGHDGVLALDGTPGLGVRPAR